MILLGKVKERKEEVKYGVNDPAFSLDGKYSYNEVEFLAQKIGSIATYGFSAENGPVAFLDLYNPNVKELTFNGVWEYGKHGLGNEYSFESYCKEQAQNIQNFTVYGTTKKAIIKIRDFVKFEKISLFFDSRYKIKSAKIPKVADMMAMLDGRYSYSRAIYFASKEEFKMVDNSITFVIVDDKFLAGIIGLKKEQVPYIKGFRDVYEFDEDIPKIRSIEFLPEKRAKKVKYFRLYIYDYVLPYGFEDMYDILKIDRTFNSHFDFYNTKSGKDLRLLKRKELLIK